MEPVNLVTVTMRDFFGFSAQVRFHVPASVVSPSDPVIVAIVSALNAMLHCVSITVEITAGRGFSNTAGTGAYIAEDKMLLVTTDPDGLAHTFKLPSFHANILDPSNLETLLLTQATVVDLSAAIETYALTAEGNSLSAITSGHRITSPRELKN